jgi:hypothetical protein
MVIAQQIDNHFISPVVMKRAVHLHPAAVMMALLIGGTLSGFFGLLIAVPLAAALKIVVGHVWRKYVLGMSVPGLDVALPLNPPDLSASPQRGSGAHRAMGPTDEPETVPAAPSNQGPDPSPDPTPSGRGG